MCSVEISRKRISVVEAQQLVVLLRNLRLMQAEISTCEETEGRGKRHAENETDEITLSPTKLYSTLQGAVERMAVPSCSTSLYHLVVVAPSLL